MDYRGAKGTRLAFKGGAKTPSAPGTKKARRKPRPQHDHDAGAAADRGEAHSGWVPISAPDDLVGPVAFYHRGGDGGIYVLALPTADKALALPSTSEARPTFRRLHNTSLATAAPTRVEEVFVGRRSVPAAASTQQERHLFSFRSCRGTYLSASSAGDVSCSAAAIGPLEMWTPVLLPEISDRAVALKIQPPGVDADRHLGIDLPDELPPAGAPAHARSAAVGPGQVLIAMCQAAHHESRQASRKHADARLVEADREDIPAQPKRAKSRRHSPSG